MRKILLIAISGISFCTMPVQAQFNTIAKTPERYKVEALQEGMKKPEPTPESMAPAQETSTKPADESKKLWIDRYLSVSYPLQRIRITSPYGYRKDPFTGKRKFHGGIDLHARGEQVLAMMEGVLAAKGTVVRPRDAVGITGSTGRSTGEHLHVTCKLNGKNINPSVLFDYIKSMQQECVSALAGLL